MLLHITSWRSQAFKHSAASFWSCRAALIGSRSDEEQRSIVSCSSAKWISVCWDVIALLKDWVASAAAKHGRGLKLM
ncbi:MAG: hypothetical protein DRI90_13400 [Deltaproteobacteria bacterium]|nr:MAG: hypothetical protein DRI90_13400 [Deltaproteobacteria bacterium]